MGEATFGRWHSPHVAALMRATIAEDYHGACSKTVGRAERLRVIEELVQRARAAMESFAKADQARVDEAVTALAWSLYKPEHAKELAALAVADTGLGNVPDKI